MTMMTMFAESLKTFVNSFMKMVAMTRICALILLAVLVASRPANAQDTVIYYHIDAIGSVRMITDANGGVLARYDFEPFGVACGSACGTGTPPETIQFAGKERDTDTGFDYVGARYYASETGRFTTVDPGHVAGSLFNPQTWNAYAYALNNPLRFVDPFGLAPCPPPTDTSACVEGRAGTGELVFDSVRWQLESLFWNYWNWRMQEPEVMGGTPFAPPIFRGARLFAGSIRNVNPLRSATNCVNCSIATDATLAGHAASALPSGPTSVAVLEATFGGQFVRVTGQSAIEAQLLSAGPGARGIIFGSRGPGQVGHVFNGVNQGGTVRFLDGQTGTVASFQGFKEFYFLRTWP